MSSDLWTTNGIPSKDGGNIYGKAGETVASLTINGGEFYCKTASSLVDVELIISIL